MNKLLEGITFYEIYPNSFCDSNNDGYGDFKGIISKLDYVQSLGVKGIWLNPHYDSPFKDGGYDVKDFYKCSPRFGSEEDFDEMVNEIHKRGMILIVDLVAGHSSEECEMFIKSAEPYENEYSDLYVWNNNPWNTPSGMKFQNGRYQRNGCFLINFFVTQPAFNYGFYKVDDPTWQMSYKDPRTFKARDLMVNICKYWLSRGVDGFRVDMASSLVKNDPWDEKEGTIEVWHYIFDNVKKEYPNAVFVSEWGGEKQHLSFKAGFDMDFVLENWGTFYNKLVRLEYPSKGQEKSYFRKESNVDINPLFKQIIKRITEQKDKGYFSFISGNHDVERCSENFTEHEMKFFMMWLFTMPGVPYLYYGDEIFMKYQRGLPSVECGYHRTGSRTPMVFDHSKNKGFSNCEKEKLFLPIDETTSVIDEENNKDSLLHTVRDLIHLRNNTKSLWGNNIEYVELEKEVMSYTRNDLLIIINPHDKQIAVDKGEIIYQIGDIKTSKDKIILLPQSGIILRK